MFPDGLNPHDDHDHDHDDDDDDDVILKYRLVFVVSSLSLARSLLVGAEDISRPGPVCCRVCGDWDPSTGKSTT